MKPNEDFYWGMRTPKATRTETHHWTVDTGNTCTNLVSWRPHLLHSYWSHRMPPVEWCSWMWNNRLLKLKYCQPLHSPYYAWGRTGKMQPNVFPKHMMKVFKEVPLRGIADAVFLPIKVSLLCQSCTYILDLHSPGALITSLLSTLLTFFSDHSHHASEAQD